MRIISGSGAHSFDADNIVLSKGQRWSIVANYNGKDYEVGTYDSAERVNQVWDEFHDAYKKNMSNKDFFRGWGELIAKYKDEKSFDKYLKTATDGYVYKFPVR